MLDSQPAQMMVCKCNGRAYEPAEDSSYFGTIVARHPGVTTTTVASSLELGERSAGCRRVVRSRRARPYRQPPRALYLVRGIPASPHTLLCADQRDVWQTARQGALQTLRALRQKPILQLFGEAMHLVGTGG